MASLLNKQLLDDIGITLSDEDNARLSEHFETTLDERVAQEIVIELDDTQLTQLTELRNGPEAELGAWLQANVPDLKEIIEDETAILLGELAENSEKF